MKTVPLYGKKSAGRVAVVDDEDYDLVMQYRWHVVELSRPGRPCGPYAVTELYESQTGRMRATRMHRLLTGWPRTDHVDHNGLNNQRSNLRPASSGQNGANRRPNLRASSQFKGVRWYPKLSKWCARVTKDGHTFHLGYFTSEIEAARAYDAAALTLWGEYAYLNNPDNPERLTVTTHGR